MPLLSDYEQRTAWKYEPICGTFHTHEGLRRKVGLDGDTLDAAVDAVQIDPRNATMFEFYQEEITVQRFRDCRGQENIIVIVVIVCGQ